MDYGRAGPKKGVWNFQALEIPAFIGLGEFQTPFLGKAAEGARLRLALTRPGAYGIVPPHVSEPHRNSRRQFR